MKTGYGFYVTLLGAMTTGFIIGVNMGLSVESLFLAGATGGLWGIVGNIVDNW